MFDEGNLHHRRPTTSVESINKPDDQAHPDLDKVKPKWMFHRHGSTRTPNVYLYTTGIFVFVSICLQNFVLNEGTTSIFGDDANVLIIQPLYTFFWNPSRSSSLECRHLEQIRQLDRQPLDPSTPSIFNCHSPHGKCQYYRPAHFFHPTCGISSRAQTSTSDTQSRVLIESQSSSQRESTSMSMPALSMDTIRKHLHDMRKLRIGHRLWKDQPPTLIAWASFMKEMRMKKSGRHFMRQNLSFIHVHKAAGTSLVSSFRDLTLYKDNKKDTDSNSGKYDSKESIEGSSEGSIDVDKYKGLHVFYHQGRSMELNDKAWNRTSAFLDQAVRYQREEDWEAIESIIDDTVADSGNSNAKELHQKRPVNHVNHMMVAVVRDPIERFISAVGQVTASKFSKKGSPKMLKDKCLQPQLVESNSQTLPNKTASEVLRCFVNIIKSEGYWVDIHFTPMILELSFSTMQKDIPVAIFPFDEVPNLLAEIGSSPNKKKKDGKKDGYRPSMLVNATIDDLEDEVLRDLCELYHMDVLFLRDLGYATNCDGIQINL